MKKPTIAEYCELGDDIAELWTVYSDLHHKAANYLGKTRGCSKQFFTIQNIISKIKSDLEDDMFKQYPEVDNEYLNVFYGGDDGRLKFRLDHNITVDDEIS